MVHGLSAVDTGTFFEIEKLNHTREHNLKLKKGRVATDLRQQLSLKESLILGTIWKQQ